MEHTWSSAYWEGSNATHRWWLLDKQLTSETAVGKQIFEKRKQNKFQKLYNDAGIRILFFRKFRLAFVRDGKMCDILWSASETGHLKHVESIAERSAVTAHSSAKLFSLSLVSLKSKPSIKLLFILIGQPRLPFIKPFDLPKHSFPQDPTACSDSNSVVNTTYSYKQNLARLFRQ